MRKPIVFLLSLTLLLLVVLPAGAAPPPPLPPTWNFDGLTIEYQRVDVTIENQIATTHIDQLFVNDADWMAEGVYLFPLPAGATVTELIMWVDGVAIEAEILDATEARQIYDEIVRQLRDPALLEYIGTGAIQANVFPIPAHDERRIEIEYSQLLPAENGLFHYVFPQSTNLYTNLPLDSQSIRVDIRSDETLHNVYSPSHPVAVNRESDFHAVAGYEADNVLADSDFELYYTVSAEEIGLNLVTYKESGQDGFFLLMAAPTVTVDANEVVAKDVIMVLDTSGSMHGEKMAQAKEAALFVVENLNAQDRFNIVTFSTGVRSLAPSLLPAGEPGGYRSFIDSIEAIGGTNISLALLEAVKQADDSRPTTIIFMTDGIATEGIVATPDILSTVAEATPGNVRIFAFGVGDDVDTLLLDSLTEAHRGTTSYVRPTESIDEEIANFYVKISSPVLANISLDFGDIVVEQMYPSTLPDLFAGTQLILVGRYRSGGPATIRLNGEVNGATRNFVYEDNFFVNNGGDEFIPRLWATRAIGHLLNEIRLHGENPELVESIVTLSLRYGIITPYTSFLITEDDIFTQSSRDTFTEEAMADMDAADGEVVGEAAVEEAEAAAGLAGADTAAPAPTAPQLNSDGSEGANAAAPALQYVGSKTFVWRSGVWIDTTFDADNQTPQRVGFASDNYFDLLDAAPELGQYFALGERVLVVFDGVAYEIVAGAGDNAVTLPDPTVGSETTAGGESIGTTTNPDGGENNGGATTGGNDSGGVTGICGAPLFMPLLLGLVFVSGRRRKRD